MKFNIDDYPGRVVMHCPTLESATIFCGYLASAGRLWVSGSSYTEDTLWEYAKENTVYAFNEGRRGDIISGVVREVYDILEFNDFDWDDDDPNPDLITFADLLANAD